MVNNRNPVTCFKLMKNVMRMDLEGSKGRSVHAFLNFKMKKKHRSLKMCNLDAMPIIMEVRAFTARKNKTWKLVKT